MGKVIGQDVSSGEGDWSYKYTWIKVIGQVKFTWMKVIGHWSVLGGWKLLVMFSHIPVGQVISREW